jgi:hypothetical protein
MQAIHFEIITYLVWIVTVVLLLTVWKGHRDYWFLFFATTLSFPFEWISDNLWMFLQYDWSFTMMFGRFPLFMPFAWTWFFGLPLILLFRYEDKIDKLPLWVQIIGMWIVFFLWDFQLETISSGFGLWKYYWPEGYLFWGVPLLVPIFVGISFLMYYYGHKYLRRFSAGRGWVAGIVIHVVGFQIMNIIRACVGWSISVKLMGIVPEGMEIIWPW